MQTFAPLLGLANRGSTPPPATGSQPMIPTAFAAFASQIRANQLQSLLQSQLLAMQNSPQLQEHKPSTAQRYNGKTRDYTHTRKRVGGSTVKTAKVWRYFDELPTVEQAAECRICRKKIKATNSSTTGMIRHLRSCHVQEYQVVQEARQSSMIVKMEEKARAKLLREMNDKVTCNIANQIKKEHQESQKSPSASSSASDTASSSSHFSTVLPPTGLPAPKPIKPAGMYTIKTEATEMEEEEKPTDLSVKSFEASAFSSFSANDLKTEIHKKIEDDQKIHMQIALMLLLDQQPPQLIDRPGFRSLFRFLLPKYQMPSSEIFQNLIMPQLVDHMKQQISGIFSNNNNNSARFPETESVETPNTTTFDALKLSTLEQEEKEDEDETVEVEDDTSSASSSIDTDQSDTINTFINSIGSDTYPRDELISLISVVSNIYNYFASKPLVLSIEPLSASASIVDQVHFVSKNLSAISSYIRHNPDMQILPLSASQESLLEELVKTIEKVQ